MRKRNIILCLAIVVGVAVWYWFRPELLFVNARVDERFPEDGSKAVVVAAGSFHSVAHDSKGKATVYRLSDGRNVLRFSEFETSNGPALRVKLIAAADASDSAEVKVVDRIDLGELKGNIGDQNYDLPADVDLSKYRAVTIWCQRFSVNFATAPLTVGQDSDPVN